MLACSMRLRSRCALLSDMDSSISAGLLQHTGQPAASMTISRALRAMRLSVSCKTPDCPDGHHCQELLTGEGQQTQAELHSLLLRCTVSCVPRARPTPRQMPRLEAACNPLKAISACCYVSVNRAQTQPMSKLSNSNVDRDRRTYARRWFIQHCGLAARCCTSLAL